METKSKRRKRGDVREDGKVFLQYNKGCIDGEHWVTPERLEYERTAKREYYVRRRAADLEFAEKQREYRRERRANLKGIKQDREYAQRPEVKARREKRSKERRASDPLYALKQRARSLVSRSLRGGGYSKNSLTAAILGCSFEEFFSHIEDQFVDGMCWERFDEIHIDHRIPLASSSSAEDTAALNHYTNLQPLWATDNLRKGVKILN